MKSLPFTLSLALLTPSLLFAEADKVRQIQTENGFTVSYDMPIYDDQGTVTSSPLDSDYSVFQLWATESITGSNGQTTDSPVKLDEKTVGTFIPSVSIQFESEDDFSPPRTRADRPYGLTVRIAGLSSDPEAPAYAKSVEASRSYKIYDPATWAEYTGGNHSGEYSEDYDFNSNGTFTDEAISQRLPSDSPTTVAGEETFTVRLDPDALAENSELANATIQIWPVASAGIAGLEEGETYQNVPLSSTLVLERMYPDSVTYAQVYPGPRNFGTVGTVIEASIRSYGVDPSGVDTPTLVPQRAIIPLADMDISKALTGDGTYTMEILTVTPFNNREPELLADVTFDVDRTLSVRAQLTTEK